MVPRRIVEKRSDLRQCDGRGAGRTILFAPEAHELPLTSVPTRSEFLRSGELSFGLAATRPFFVL